MTTRTVHLVRLSEGDVIWRHIYFLDSGKKLLVQEISHENFGYFIKSVFLTMVEKPTNVIIPSYHQTLLFTT